MLWVCRPMDIAEKGVLCLLQLLLLVFLKVATGIRNSDYACRGTFTSGEHMNGTFASPRYPRPYPANIHCEYRFLADPNNRFERVQIMFTDFDLFYPNKDNPNCYCKCDVRKKVMLKNETGRPTRDRIEAPREDKPFCCLEVDVVSVYTVVNESGNRLEAEIDEYCGFDPVENFKMMSSDSEIVVRFQSHALGSNMRGFKGIYRFVEDFGVQTDTKLMNQTSSLPCTFTFNSSVTKDGKFSSPNHPGIYPKNTRCQYIFHGITGEEKIKLDFSIFDVEGIYPCLERTESDYIEFSNFETFDRKEPRYCGGWRPYKMHSDMDYYRVTFQSNDIFDAFGFDAEYQFVKVSESPHQTASAIKLKSNWSCHVWIVMICTCLYTGYLS